MCGSDPLRRWRSRYDNNRAHAPAHLCEMWRDASRGTGRGQDASTSCRRDGALKLSKDRRPALRRIGPGPARHLVPEPSELTLGIAARIGLADGDGLVQRDLTAEV